MPRTRIVYLLEDLKRGGVQGGALLQTPRLNREKFDIRVWTLEPERDGESNELARDFQRAGIHIEHIPVHGLHDGAGIVRLARRLADGRIGLLNTKSFAPNLVGRIAARVAGVPACVANYHNTYRHRWAAKTLAYERTLAPRTDAFLCVSEAVRSYLRPLLGLPADRIALIYNGIDLEAMESGETRAEARNALGLASDAPLIAYVGRLTAIKDVSILINAMPRILDRIPAARALIVGAGPDRGRLERLAEAKGLGAAVQFLESRDDVPRILRAVDCLTLTSRVEGFPRIVLEAFAAGAPVVSTPVDGVNEIVEEGESGLLFDFGDDEGLARAVIATIERPAETERRRTKARETAQRYSLAHWNAETEALFDKVIEARAPDIALRREQGARISPWGMRKRLMAIRVAARLRTAWGRLRGERAQRRLP